MTFYIETSLDGQLLSTEQYGDNLFESAKAHAREVVVSGIADRAEIRDDERKLVFHYPRVTRSA